MRLLFVCLAAYALASACREEKYRYLPTPQGYALAWENVQAVPDLYTRDEVGRRFDVAVDDAIVYLAKYGVSGAYVRDLAKAHRHVGFDGARFRASASPTGWASGAYHEKGRTIALAFFSRAKGDVVPPDAPAWTVYEWGAIRPSPKYDWGFEPPVFPALGHEYGHAIYGGAFEHGWAPPVVAKSTPTVSDADWSLECSVHP